MRFLGYFCQNNNNTLFIIKRKIVKKEHISFYNIETYSINIKKYKFKLFKE